LTADPDALAWVFPAAFATLCTIPTLVFIAVDPPTRRFLRERIRADSRRVHL
jgi:hypothetical protein